MGFIVPNQDKGDSPRRIYDGLVEACEEHAHLKDGQPRVAFLLKKEKLVLGGRQVLGSVHLPKVQGRLKEMFGWMLKREFGFDPEFVVILDWEYWEAATPEMREILMFHEMLHMAHAVDSDGEPRYNDDTGRPVFALRGHDVEEFSETVARYGAHSEEIQQFVAACAGTAYIPKPLQENNHEQEGID